ncbi:TPA: dihydroorotate dehydrogenase [Candidatus Galligastranaerophilus gallistercoris]|nr:dihydroorotate dehydrogenase [Candidatus Galligastranaerophilus gallistercoris]
MADLSVNLNGFKLKNPIMTASGTFGYCDEFEDFLDVSKLGAIVTKAITINPKKGNEGERIFETQKGMINRIGLENVGIKEFIDKKLPVLKEKNINFIMNLAGSSFEDYIETAKIAQNAKIEAIEVNVSCPNVKSGCLEFGTTPESLSKLTESIRKVYKGFLIIKLTPNVSDIESLALAAQNSGADCISAINTIKGLGIKIEITPDKKFKKTFVQGGLSGRCIKPVALSMVKRIKSMVKIPIIGIGGIATLDDVLEFLTAGADAVQIGTENFTHPDICEKLINELNHLLDELNIADIEELKRKLRE